MSGQLSAACLPAVQVSFWPSFKTYEVLFITAKRFRKFNTPSQNYAASIWAITPAAVLITPLLAAQNL